MAQPTKFSALIVDPESENRFRLKEATRALYEFDTVETYATLVEAQNRLQAGEEVNLVFISSRFKDEALPGFLEKSKAGTSGRDSAYVLVMKGKDQTGSNVSNHLVGGLDGFLLEPYSVDNLRSMTDLSLKIKSDRSKSRERAAMGFKVNDLMKQVDRCAYLITTMLDPSVELKRLRTLSEPFRNLPPDSLDIYFETLLKRAEKTVPPDYLKKAHTIAKLHGRSRQKMQEKIIAEMQNANPAEEAAPEQSQPSVAATPKPAAPMIIRKR